MWQDIEVGDFLKVQKDESFPCDILFVKCAAKNGIAFVDTMNLDGEVPLFFLPHFFIAFQTSTTRQT